MDKAKLFEDIHEKFLHGDLETAQKESENARAAFSIGDPKWAMRFQLMEAEILMYQGLRPAVISILKCSDPSFPVTGSLAIKRYLLCGQTHARLGQAQESDAEIANAEHLSYANNSALLGEVFRTEAQVQIYRGHLASAQELFRRSLQLARMQKDSYLEAADLLNLGMASVDLRHYDEALTLLKEASDASESIKAATISQAAAGDIGMAHLYLGDYSKALLSFQKAADDAKATGGVIAQITWLLDAGSCYTLMGQMDEASVALKQSLQLANQIHDPAEIAAVSVELGFLLYDEKQYETAKAYSDQALSAARNADDETDRVQALFLQAMLAEHQSNSNSAGHLLIKVLDKSAAVPTQRPAIESELANFYVRSKRPVEADRWYRNSIATYETDRAAIHEEELRLPFFANGDTIYRHYADFLIDSNKQADALSLLDQGRARTLAEGLRQSVTNADWRNGKRFDPKAIARQANGVLLFYSLGPEKSYLWAVSKSKIQLYLLPGSSEIETRVRAYNKSILESEDASGDTDENASYLYRILVGPASAMILPDSNVIVLPDGALNQLNFETLLAPGKEGSHYWIEDVTLMNASSIRLLSKQAAGSESQNPRALLLMGDPVTKGTGFENLPNAAVEVSKIEAQFSEEKRTVLTKERAVPSAYTSSIPERFSYIHFVAHGTASQLSPLDSAVVLSPPESDPGEFKLYARDIVNQPIHADLVTISACYGSGIRTYVGEGLVGLSWAFLRAGSHKVISALWAVDDAATPQLMEQLYREMIARNASPEAALRTAKLSLVHSKGIYRKPLYWAAFQVYAGS